MDTEFSINISPEKHPKRNFSKESIFCLASTKVAHANSPVCA